MAARRREASICSGVDSAGCAGSSAVATWFVVSVGRSFGPTPAGWGAGVADRRFVRRPLVRGREVVREEEVADMKEEFAAFRIGVGRARRMRWDVGMLPAFSPLLSPVLTTDSIWLGGIHGARRWILPRMWPGMRSAVARA